MASIIIPLVSIRCLVYNHEPYLRQCLDGFVMQKTNFPFEAIVHDDASTDGSAAIIREYAEKYPDIIKPIYETENQYSKRDGSLTRAMDAAMHPGSKYVASCEGDDYWTDPEKLQKQVDIMEANPEIGLVHSKANVYNQQSGNFLGELWGQPIDSFEDELILNRPVTLTTCYRRDLLDRFRVFRENAPRNWKMGDYPLWLFLSYYTKTYFIDEPTGTYRLMKHSACHKATPQEQADFELSIFDIQSFFAKEFHREHLLKTLATNLVHRLNQISTQSNTVVKYDFLGLYHNYGLNNGKKLMILHYLLKYRFSRVCYRLWLRTINHFRN